MGQSTAGFDILTTISQESLTHQIGQLFKHGVIVNTLKLDMADTGLTLDATLAAPTVALAGTGTDAEVLFSLNMPSGQFTYYEGFGPKAKQESLTFTDWVYVFRVSMNFAKIAQQDIQDSVAVPPVVKQTLSAFSDDMFTIQHLFLDFENADIASFDTGLTKMPVTGGGNISPGTMTQWQLALKNYFASLAGTANPYILGYAVAATSVHTGGGSPPMFNPTGATFSTFLDSDTPGESTLNFLLMTSGNPLPPVPPNGILTASPISSSSYDGAMAVDGSTFSAAYVEGQLLPLLAGASGIVGDFTRANDVWSASTTRTNLDQNKGYGRIVAVDSGMINIYEQMHDVRQCTVRLDRSNGPAVLASGSISERFDYYWYPLDIKGTLGNLTTQLAWTLRIQIGAGANGTFVVTSTFSDGGGVHQSSSESGIERYIGSWGGGWFNSRLAQVSQEAAGVEQAAYSSVTDGMQSGLNMLSQRVVLPGADEFFFQNARFTPTFDLVVDVVYKAEH